MSFFFATMIFLPLGLLGVVSDWQAIRGKIIGAYAIKARIAWSGALLVFLAAVLAWAWTTNSLTREELIWALVSLAVCCGWWLLHWIVMRDIIRRITARHDLQVTFEEST